MMGALHRGNISASDGEFEVKYDATSTAWAPFAVVGTDNKDYVSIY